jgi:hypothetical protein
VTVKLLPFDNKSEVQLVVDMPEGTSLEQTGRVLEQASAIARQIPEVTAMEAYAGTAAPFNFNGLVRHYFLRAAGDGRCDGQPCPQGRAQPVEPRHCGGSARAAARLPCLRAV